MLPSGVPARLSNVSRFRPSFAVNRFQRSWSLHSKPRDPENHQRPLESISTWPNVSSDELNGRIWRSNVADASAVVLRNNAPCVTTQRCCAGSTTIPVTQLSLLREPSEYWRILPLAGSSRETPPGALPTQIAPSGLEAMARTLLPPRPSWPAHTRDSLPSAPNRCKPLSV